MTQVKVEQTEVYKDSQGEHIVCKGKLVLIKTPNYQLDYAIQLKNEYYKPIVVSETEGLILDDYVLDENEIHQLKNPAGLYYAGDLKKILALPEQFSPKHLQAIIDGKLKDNDELLIECDRAYAHFKADEHRFVKLDREGHIKIFPIKKEESWDDIQQKWIRESNVRTHLDLISWLKENYYSPKKK